MKKFIAILVMIAAGSFAVNYNGDTLVNYNAYNDGTVMAKYFSHATGNSAYSNATVYLTKIPEKSRIIGGTVSVTAMGGAQVFSMGLAGADGSGLIGNSISNSTSLFLSNIACSNAVVDTFANQANGDSNANYIGNTKDTYLTITAPSGAAAWSVSNTISGVVYYIAY